MKHAVYAPNFNDYGEPERLLELALASEEAGFDGFFLWDHLVFSADPPLPVSDAIVTLGAIAAATRRLRLGTMVTPLARRRPWKLARELVTLDRLSGGRVTLGVGLGEPAALEFAAFGENPSARARAGRLDGGLAILDALVRGEPVDREDDYYRVSAPPFAPVAKQRPRFPIWVAATLPATAGLRRAARWDGVFPVSMPPDRGLRADGTIDWSRWWLTSRQLRDACAAIKQYREAENRAAADDFDCVAGGRLGEAGANGESLQAFAAAGATWWCHWANEKPGTHADNLAAVRRGVPP